MGGRGGDAHPGPGLREERPPGISATGLALGAGAIWGVLGYSVLWEGTPFAVQRPFVRSIVGTLVLLPVRAVLWAIHRAEILADRTFDLSANHWWIGVAAGVVGAAIGAGVGLIARAAVRRRSAGRRAA
ncbi:MAG: hypothetical protein ACXWDS_04580 [Actinomycetota bacterium]